MGFRYFGPPRLGVDEACGLGVLESWARLTSSHYTQGLNFAAKREREGAHKIPSSWDMIQPALATVGRMPSPSYVPAELKSGQHNLSATGTFGQIEVNPNSSVAEKLRLHTAVPQAGRGTTLHP